MDRFIKTTPEVVGEESCDFHPTQWWLDTARPIEHPEQKFMGVETEMDKDPNNFVKVDGMCILFTDQAEYYFVCKPCWHFHSHQQWSGSTRSSRNWRENAEKECKEYESTKGWCEFCDPIFGNGGWS